MRTTACIVTLIALTSLALATAARAPAAPPWRAFAPSSPWNVPAAPQSIGASNPYASQFAGSSNFTMKLSGTPDNPKYSSPIYFASPGDPVASVNVGQPGWAPSGLTKYNGQPIPVPAGVTPASGSDGHLTVVSADRKTAWEFWRCTSAGVGGYTTEVIVQWDLTGSGVATKPGDNSARGSGTPLISTTLRAEEALNGVNHALGITVPSVSSQYIYPPASHADGSGGSGQIKYGQLFVLRPDYQPPPGSSIGVRNVVQGLKTYGAYVVDQGADFEMDADFTHPDQWAAAGLSQNSFNFTAADFRPAAAGPVPPAPPPVRAAQAPKGKRKVVISANRRSVSLGRGLRILGRIRGGVPRHARVRIMVRTSHGHWQLLRRKRVNANGTFVSWSRFLRSASAARLGLPQRYKLRKLRLTRHAGVIRIRAVVARVGRSNVVRVRLIPRHIRASHKKRIHHRRQKHHRKRSHAARAGSRSFA